MESPFQKSIQGIDPSEVNRKTVSLLSLGIRKGHFEPPPCIKEEEAWNLSQRHSKAESDAFVEAVQASLKAATDRGTYFAPLQQKDSLQEEPLRGLSPRFVKGALGSSYNSSEEIKAASSLGTPVHKHFDQAAASCSPVGSGKSQLRQWAKKFFKPSSWAKNVDGMRTGYDNNSNSRIGSIDNDSNNHPLHKYGFGRGSCCVVETRFERGSCDNVQIGFGRSSCNLVHAEAFDASGPDDTTPFHRSSISPWQDDLKA
ncbi:hypothetical protein CEUSTIGMA_g14069.t1 [Chlamydomonas eustigma]|uniref:Uncharacterized protein n=1 Tax=Chlamydomonas eustigma TaxID=1157962 RepID=A0A250XU95_9CHLO|nr:hypothetical protein CEUSTIGMA_g14069.t1 [Chlamydomonas eustigma]|eukprot:GAX86661.1 hypothetical protein CEUSTIGMA_g14069.t1 [Chlamydomonas eustigma]